MPHPKKKKKFVFFKTMTFTWWQVGLFKLSTVSFGIIVGMYLGSFFWQLLPLLWLLLLIPGGYIVYLWVTK